MKNWLRLFVSLAAAGYLAAGCAPPDDSSGGSGGTTGGTGGSGAAGSGVGGSNGSGGRGTGGMTVSGTGGMAGGGTGGMTGSGGSGAGGHGMGGITGQGGRAPDGGVDAGRDGTTTDGSVGGDGSMGTYNPCPTNGDPCRILPVGDSITFGINQEGSYRIELFHKALMAMQKITYTGTLQNGPTMVDGVAFPRRYEATIGITIDGISNQITTNKTLSMPADIILVHIGTNDMYMSNPGGAPMRLGNLLDKLSTGLPNALIAVAKIIPLPSGTAAVNTFNAAIPGIVATRVAAGKHIIVVDLNTGFPSGDLSSDNVHPNPTGYAWMGDVWYNAIGALFPK
jgi:hypothetical protein